MVTPLYQQTVRTYEAGVTQGTSDNRKRQSELYLKFCVSYNVPYLSPPIIDLMMYIQFLKNSFVSQVSVKNYVSGARTWVLQHQGTIFSFDSIEVKQMLAAIDATSVHVPSPAYPLTSSDIKQVCQFIDARPGLPLAVKPCILIGYACFLRTCNLLSPSIQTWIGTHTLLASDIILTEAGLNIFLRSSKSFNTRSSRVLQIRKVLNPQFCPVTAWLRYKQQVNPCPIGPAFMVNDYTSLVSRNVVEVFCFAHLL